MSQKISELDAATAVGQTDLFVIVQGSDNLKATRAQILEGTDASNIQLAFNGTMISASPTGHLTLSPDAGSTVTMSTPAGNYCAVGGDDSFTVSSAGCVIQIDASGNLNVSGAATVFYQYIDATPGDWAGSPGHVSQALDRLAAAVAGLLGNPVP